MSQMPQDGSGNFLTYLGGWGRAVGDAYISDYINERFPRENTVEVGAGEAAPTDTVVPGSGPSADDVADKQFRLLMLAGAGALSLLLLVLVVRR